jgi:hyperosmotically inducible protein
MTFEKHRSMAAVMLTAASLPAFTYAQGNENPPQKPAAAQAPAVRPGTQDGTAVQALPGDAAADAAVGTRIRAALQTDPLLRGTDISVNSDHGVVSLTGTVLTREQSAIASAHAQREDGILRVDNDLAIPLQ